MSLFHELCRSQELISVQMPEQNKLSTKANNTGCQDYELLAEYHSDIGQGRPRPTGTRAMVVKGNGKQIL